MSRLLDEYNLKKQARKNFETWNNKPNSENKYQNSKFDISIVHCRAPILVRAGQHCCGGKNYWETEQDTNLMILEYLVENWSSIAPDILNRLKAKEKEALKSCQIFIDEMQEMIDNC